MDISMEKPLRVAGYSEYSEYTDPELCCSYFNIEDIDKITFNVNKFLSRLSDDLDVWQKLEELTTWLESHNCIIDVRLYSLGHYPSGPSVRGLEITFDENGATRTIIMEIALTTPLKVRDYAGIGYDCEGELFYYYRDEKTFLDHRFLNDWLLVGFYEHAQDAEIVDYINKTGLFKPVDADDIAYRVRPDWVWSLEGDSHLIFVNTQKSKTCLHLKEIIRTLEKSPIVSFANLTIEVRGCIIISECADIGSFSQYFNVMVKDMNDLSDLYAVVQETNTWIAMVPSQWTPNWFIIGTDKNSKGNALKMAQYFYETGKFIHASPDFINGQVNR